MRGLPKVCTHVEDLNDTAVSKRNEAKNLTEKVFLKLTYQQQHPWPYDFIVFKTVPPEIAYSIRMRTCEFCKAKSEPSQHGANAGAGTGMYSLEF